MRRDGVEHGVQWIPEAALDVIHYTLMTDPVVAEDDQTYDRVSIEAWFAACRAEGRPLTSPLTGATIGDVLRPNWNAKKLVDELQERDVQAVQHGGGDESCAMGGGGTACGGSGQDGIALGATSVQAMAKVFEAIDPLRDLFSTMDWKPPRIVVLGNEKAGKSSTLERLANLPVFPKDTELCTRMAIELRLRRQPATLPVIQVLDISGNEERIIKTVTCPMETSGAFVNEAMMDIIRQESGRAFSKDRMLRILVNSPEVCNLDLVDTPGLLAAARDPANIRIVQDIVNRQIDLSPHALFLVILPGNQSITDSIALNLIRKRKLEKSSMAIVTRADVCDRDMYGNSTGYAQLRPLLRTLEQDYQLGYGAVMVSNREALQTTTHYERLHQMAVSESALFVSEAFRDLKGKVSISAAVDRLGQMFNSYVRDTWVPMTFAQLHLEAEALQSRDKELGLPRAHEEATSRHPEATATLAQAAHSAVRQRLADQTIKISDGLVTKTDELAKQLGTGVSKSGAIPLSHYRERLATRSMEANHCVDAWIVQIPLAVAQAFVDVLAKDSSEFRVGRFPTLIEGIRRRVLERLATHQADLRVKMRSRVDRFLDDPTTPNFRVEYQLGGQVMVTYNHQALADAVIEAVVTSPLLDIASEVLKEDFVALPDVDWLESCYSERRQLLTRLELIRAAEEHIKATLNIDAQQAADILRTVLEKRKQPEAPRQVAKGQSAAVTASVDVNQRVSPVLPQPFVSVISSSTRDGGGESRTERLSSMASQLPVIFEGVAEPTIPGTARHVDPDSSRSLVLRPTPLQTIHEYSRLSEEAQTITSPPDTFNARAEAYLSSQYASSWGHDGA